MIACLLVVAVLATGGKLRWASNDGPDATPIALPPQMAGLYDYIDALTTHGGQTPDQIAAVAARLDRTYATTVNAYRQAYSGAAAIVRRYAGPDLALVLTVVAVRASSTPLLAGVLDDPADAGLIAQPLEVVTIGLVSCLVRRYLHGPGGDLDSLNQQTDECQLSVPGQRGTVWVFAQGAETSADQRTVVQAAAMAYQQVVPPTR